MDPEASELVLPSDPLLTGLPSYFTVTTRDQDGKRVYVGDMKVQSQLCLVMTTTAHQHIQNDVHFLNQVFFWSEPGGGEGGEGGGGRGQGGI